MKSAANMTMAAMVLVALAGCERITPDRTAQAPQPVPQTTAPADISTYIPHSAVRTEDGSESAVDAAIRWEQKYSEASDKLVKQQLESRQQQEELQRLKDKVDKLTADLVTAQSQLKDANAMLMDVRNELDKWKASVLGFRQEMRDAQQAQMTALAKVIKLLGGEATPTTAASTTQPAAPSGSETPLPAKALANSKEAHGT